MRCSVCGKETSAIFTKDDKTFYCDECNRKRVEKIRRATPAANFCARFERKDDEGKVVQTCPRLGDTTMELRPDQVISWNERLKDTHWECITCKERRGKDWEEVSMPDCLLKLKEKE